MENQEEWHKVIIALGTNRNTSAGDISSASSVFDVALRLIQPLVANIVRSDAVFTEPVGVVSPMFCNQVIICNTELQLEVLERELKAVERQMGRSADKNSVDIAIDIDILKYDDTMMHQADWEREYIKILLKSMNNANMI